MSRKMKVYLIISVIFSILLIGCTNKAPEKFSLNQVTIVGVEMVKADGRYDEDALITNDETLEELRNIFKQIKWEPNVQPSINRKEDVIATLFFKYDKNMPERLFEYQTWFNENDTATIISNNESENYGTLDENNAKSLKNILLQ